MTKLAQLKAKILELTNEYSSLAHTSYLPQNIHHHEDTKKQTFVPGESSIPYAGRCFDQNEVSAAVDSVLDFWLTLGEKGKEFEKGLSDFLKVKKSLLVNSGSSANLIAFSALTSIKLGERRIKKGDEVITVAAGFPTTVAPIIQNGAVPVFIDSDPITANAKTEILEEAYVPNKTKAVLMAHALGNPFDIQAVRLFCQKYNLWLIEDNCDALGSDYTLRDNEGKLILRSTGSWGDLSTQSFYPPHHMTLGEGGSVNVCKDMRLKVIVESFRDWGRDCWCESGKDNTCRKRFNWQLGDLPHGYDHKYIYSHIGYNVKPLDIQAAIGCEQLNKISDFIQARKHNWEYLRRGLSNLSEFIDFSLPTHAKSWTERGFEWDDSGCKSDPSWFGFMMLVKDDAPFSRRDFALALDKAKIGNRMLFGGNLVRQPAFLNLKKDDPGAYRIVGDLKGADRIMNGAIFIGVYPGLTKTMLDYMITSIQNFVKQTTK